MKNILDEIAEKTRRRIALEKEHFPFDLLRTEGEKYAAERGTFTFEDALRAPGISVIAEVKKASPSKGIIAEKFPYVEIAREYEEAGASAVSCLTEPFYFLGSDQYLREIREAISIPILRKDFTVDEYMIYQASAMDAAAILLIVSLLDDGQLLSYRQLADELKLSVLVEAHTETEVERAVKAGARIIGVNNRNLKNFDVDVTNSLRLRSMVPNDCLFVSESGIRTPRDVENLRANGVDAVLIGETLMRSSDKKAMLNDLRSAGSALF